MGITGHYDYNMDVMVNRMWFSIVCFLMFTKINSWFDTNETCVRQRLRLHIWPRFWFYGTLLKLKYTGSLLRSNFKTGVTQQWKQEENSSRNFDNIILLKYNRILTGGGVKFQKPSFSLCDLQLCRGSLQNGVQTSYRGTVEKINLVRPYCKGRVNKEFSF